MDITKEDNKIFRELSAKSYITYVSEIIRTLSLVYMIIPLLYMYSNVDDENELMKYEIAIVIWAIAILTLSIFIFSTSTENKKIKITNGFNNFAIIKTGSFNMYKYYGFVNLYTSSIIDDSDVYNYYNTDYYMDAKRIKATLLKLHSSNDGNIFNIK